MIFATLAVAVAIVFAGDRIHKGLTDLYDQRERHWEFEIQEP